MLAPDTPRMPAEEVRRVAELARLDIPDEQLERVARELSAVLEFAASLRTLELAGLEPSVFAPADTPLRDDTGEGRTLTQEQALAAAPEAEDGFFIVPPIVENVQP